MLEVYIRSRDELAEAIIERLEELVLAHRVIIVQPETIAERGYPLPAIKDGSRILSEESAIRKHLEELEEEAQQWRKFQSDACYLDDKGEVC